MTTIETVAAQDGQPRSAREVETLDAGPFAAVGQSPLIDEYETAIKQGVVSFEQVVQAAFGRRSSSASPTTITEGSHTLHLRQ